MTDTTNNEPPLESSQQQQNQRQEIRQFYFQVWNKISQKQPIIDPMEQRIAHIINMHQEYHQLLDDKNDIEKDYTPEMEETNPFLHMGMHIAIHEQIGINQPVGIQSIYQSLLQKYQDPHAVEHLMIDCLGEMLWKAQSSQSGLDTTSYLNCLKLQF